MTREKHANVPASVRQKLLNIIRKTGDDPNLVWSRYATERLLYRLSISEFAGEFVLKGAMLFTVWSGEPHRPTVDLDLLGHGNDSGERIANVFRQICRMDVKDDGLVFDADNIRVSSIREDLEYHGQRVNLVAHLGKARIPIQVDIGFGDVITPKAEDIEYPTLLELPAPRIRAYPRETVVAEKLHAMVVLGIANSRMKDFYDLHMLASRFAFDGAILARAVKATFKRRKTPVPSVMPLALTEEFGHDVAKNVQWNAFIRKGSLKHKALDLMEVVALLREFLFPITKAATDQVAPPKHWDAGGPWVM